MTGKEAKKAQRDIQKHFEKMYQVGKKPWKEHRKEDSFDEFLKLLDKKIVRSKVLDLGCGDGWLSVKAASEGHEVWGIDSSETAIKEAKVMAETQGVERTTHFFLIDALALPFKNNFFEAIIDRGLFHHILPENRFLYFQNILYVLKSGSLFYLSVFSNKNFEGVGQLFTPLLVKELFKENFEILNFKQDSYPNSLPAHLLHFIMERK